jgi:hypothetical protein
MPVQKELHGATGIKAYIQISGIGQEEDKTIQDPGRDPPLHPVHLGLLSGKKLQFMKDRLLAFLPVLSGMEDEPDIAASVSIGLEAVIHLLRQEIGMFLIPLLDQALIRSKEVVSWGLLYTLTA